MGVFADEDIPMDQVVCLYPGTLYMAWEPVLFQSIRNRYMFRLSDGSYLDGKSEGLSKFIYKSCYYQGHLGTCYSCDYTWMDHQVPSQHHRFSIGQYVNHTENNPNINYIEINLNEENFPLFLRPFLSTVLYSSIPNWTMRVIVLVSTRPIRKDEELLVKYFDL